MIVSNIQSPERLTAPLKDDQGYFYPVTSYNQIIMPDGTFWNGDAAETGAIFVDRTGAVPGVPHVIDADTLGGLPANNYALKEDLQKTIPVIPEGGMTDQILAKSSPRDNDLKWIDKPNADMLAGGYEGQILTKISDVENDATWTDLVWDNIKNKPKQYSPSTHQHNLNEISNTSTEEWTFVLLDGSTVTRKVIMSNA